MRCRFCHASSGWFRRRCRTCAALWAIYETSIGNSNLAEFLALFEAAGATPDQIDAFLRADPDGAGAIQDRITAEMANQVLQALGRSGRQTAADVRRLRERGAWRSYDQRPTE